MQAGQVALIFAFKRVEWHVEIQRLNTSYLDARERRGKLMQVVQSSQPALNTQSGDVATPKAAADEARHWDEFAKHAREIISERQDSSLRFYKWRNRFFVLGFFLLVTSRVLAAYEY